jgi:hypothetical protein
MIDAARVEAIVKAICRRVGHRQAGFCYNARKWQILLQKSVAAVVEP